MYWQRQVPDSITKVVQMELFHGSYSAIPPEILIGDHYHGLNNIFDGLFASTSRNVAASHGDYVFMYEVEHVADNSDLNERIRDVFDFLKAEINADDEVIESLSYAIADDKCDDAFAEFLSPRSDVEPFADASWEMQRLRGRVAAHLGFDAVEMDDEHGISWLIVNPLIRAAR